MTAEGGKINLRSVQYQFSQKILIIMTTKGPKGLARSPEFHLVPNCYLLKSKYGSDSHSFEHYLSRVMNNSFKFVNRSF